MKELPTIKCPDCGKSDAFTLFPDKDKRMYRCDNCGLIILRKPKLKGKE